jgi:hypothetical protein
MIRVVGNKRTGLRSGDHLQNLLCEWPPLLKPCPFILSGLGSARLGSSEAGGEKTPVGFNDFNDFNTST